MNGIVLSRDRVVSGTAGDNGIVAGWTDSSTTFTDRDSALTVFRSLVSGPGLVVKNYFGYHTAETFGFSEAAAMPSSGETSEEESDTQYDLPLIVRN